MFRVRIIAVVVASAGLCSPAFAQSSTSSNTSSSTTSSSASSTSSSTSGTTTTRHRKPGEVNRRLQRQNHRIQEGVDKGQLTQSQASQLSAQDSKIQAEEKSDRTANNGKLTQPQRQQINSELDQLSRQIRAEREAKAQSSSTTQSQSK